MADCMNCGMCDHCIDRTIAAAEDANPLARWTEAELTKLLRQIGCAINANDGRCGLIEDVLIRSQSLVLDHLKRVAPFTDAEGGR